MGSSRHEIIFPETFFPTEGFVKQVHPLYVRTMILDENRPFVYVSIEMTSLPDEEIDLLRPAAAKEAKTSPDHVWITVTHTFSAPHILPLFALKTEADREHKRQLQEILLQTVINSVREAACHMEEAEVTLTQGESAVPANRDIELEDGWWVGCGGTGPADQTLTVLKWYAGERIPAIVFHLNLQSSVLDGTGAKDGKCVSGDVAGLACAALEKRYPGTTAIFLIGSAGDTAPVRRAKGYMPSGSGWAEEDHHEAGIAIAEDLGARLANEVAETMGRPGIPVRGCLTVKNTEVTVPAKKMNQNLHELKPTRSCIWEENGEDQQPVSVLTMGELALVGVKPELTYVTDQQIKNGSPFRYTLVTTLVNGGAKYMADRSCYDRCMYEAINSPFAPGAAEHLTQAVLTMLQKTAASLPKADRDGENEMNKPYDFSCKSNILLEDEDGNRTPMSEPYYKTVEIAKDTWRILSDGDFSYLLKGEDGDAILIDTGYGAGNIREYCKSILGYDVPRAVNTHHHFDHTALNGQFDLVYMGEESVPLACQPFPSFDGICFPRNYQTRAVGDGDVIPLKGRDLLVFKVPDHAVGSIMILDRKNRLLFAGDELGMSFGKPINTTVENWVRLSEKLVPYRQDYDMVLCGPGTADPDIVKKLLDNCRAILNGAEGELQEDPPFNNWQESDAEGHIIWKRQLPHPGDGPQNQKKGSDGTGQRVLWTDNPVPTKRKYGPEPFAIVYDIRRIRNSQIE